MSNERDLAGEATEREAYLERLRADISIEEANDEWEEREANGAHYEYDCDDEPRKREHRQLW